MSNKVVQILNQLTENKWIDLDENIDLDELVRIFN